MLAWCLVAAALALLIQHVYSGAAFSRQNSFRDRNNDGGDRGTERPLPVDPDLMAFSEEIYRLDQKGNAALETVDWAVDTRSRTGKLFSRMNQALLQKPTYAKLIALLDQYNPVMGQREEVTPAERRDQSSFLDAILATPVMRKTWDFLKSKGAAPSSSADFKNLLSRIWFTVYKRRGQPDTSGFEHVFVGELDGPSPNSPVSGFHNWVRYYLEERSGRVEYQRWKGQIDPDIFGMQFKWNGHSKMKSTIRIGESPEMSIAVLTTCFLLVPNNECKLRMGGVPVTVITHKWTTKNPNEFYVASAYYDN
ncbi:hypothetical protein RvY_12775 [Ramazzottius varieornatus]|uniref:Uridylate-specific endoribonuclease n=1 Tax=Ramazzottius varieornatus TaxID=947166 RepID=A0A1D1VR23_RAMVA|nr:hypothetical protein RvY_12775 [Ramazzottius varieornatus]